MLLLGTIFYGIFWGFVKTEKVSQEISLKDVDLFDPPDIGAKISVNREILIKSLCLRFRVTTMSTQTIFSSKEVALTINFSEHYGFLLLNGKWQIFSIPYKPVPNVFEHFCFTHNGTHYIVASEGKLWFQSPFFPKHVEILNQVSSVDNIEIGPMSKDFSGNGVYFRGKVSELNLFSSTFAFDDILAITGSCDEIEKEKAFDWSEIKVIIIHSSKVP